MTARKTTPRLHIDEKTGATVLDAKKAPVKHSALRDDKLSLRVVKTPEVKVTKSSLVRAEFEKGASLTEAAKATGVQTSALLGLGGTGPTESRNDRPASGPTLDVRSGDGTFPVSDSSSGHAWGTIGTANSSRVTAKP